MMMRNISVGFALLAAMLPTLCTASNFIADSPQRPSDASRLQATVAVYLGYELVADNETVSPRITVWDEIAGKKRQFSLSFKTTVNGEPLRCQGDQGVAPMFTFAAQVVRSAGLCGSLPAEFHRGKTTMVLVYWEPEPYRKGENLLDFVDMNPATDAIRIVPSTNLMS